MFSSVTQLWGVFLMLVIVSGITESQIVTSDDPLSSWVKSATSSRPNVLFLIADDLRPKLGCYGEDNMVTPNIDFLASRSVLFNRAYSQQALCGPSRTSFLTGRRPDTTRVFDLNTYWREVAGNFSTMPQYFKSHGYITQGVGKVFHPAASSGGHNDFPDSWSRRVYTGDDNPPFADNHLAACYPVNVTRNGYLIDTDIANHAIEFFSNYTLHRRHDPFFLAVGFHKPHLPFRYPAEFEGLYPLSNIHLAEHRTRPENLTEFAWSDFEELLKYHDVSSLSLPQLYNLIPDDFQKKLRQSYSAAVSFTDDLIGRVLEALEENGLASNTIVSFIGDHGWQLGENGEWCKHTNFDIALRIPYMIHIPGVTSSSGPSGENRFRRIDALAGQRFGSRNHYTSDELVEAVDLFATISELAGLEVPLTCPEDSSTVQVCTEGTSLVPLLRHVISPSTNGNFRWKDAAYSQYPRENEKVMGHTMKTDKYRYTEWVKYNKARHTTDWGTVYGSELYAHDTDPFEFHNVVNEPSFKATVQELSQKLRDGWRHTLQEYLSSSQEPIVG